MEPVMLNLFQHPSSRGASCFTKMGPETSSRGRGLGEEFRIEHDLIAS